MVKKDLISKVEGVSAELDKLEQHYRIELSKAFEIDDQDEFQKIQLDIYNRVQELKEWKSKVEELQTSILGTEETEQTKNDPQSEVSVIKQETDEIKTQDAEKTEESNQTNQTEEIERNPETKIALTLFNETYSLKYWSAVLIKVCQEILLRKPYVMSKLDREKTLNNPGKSNFSFLQSDIKRSARKLHNGLWIEIDRTADEILKAVNTIIALADYEAEDMVIEYE